MRFMKRCCSSVLAAAFLLTLTISAFAAEKTLDECVYIRQSGPGMCTLASATMVLRGAAYLSGEENWEDITEDAVRGSAWVEGVGLSWEFSYAGYSMVHEEVSSTDRLVELLADHPEGIAAYDSCWPHAIYLTDYEEETGTFYCADPAEGTPSGRIPVTESLIRAEDVDAVWYLSEPVKSSEDLSDASTSRGQQAEHAEDMRQASAANLKIILEQRRAEENCLLSFSSVEEPSLSRNRQP